MMKSSVQSSQQRFHNGNRINELAADNITCFAADTFGRKMTLIMTVDFIGSGVTSADKRLRADPGNDPVHMTLTSRLGGQGHHKNGPAATRR